ncbi:hypothetical protein [Acinetobacter indicus]|uniref:hypothetical protein n=1 Tax=Acinetobacter indicus TaxID=756892 RepID=UPI0014444851|nr:hypothetical protein [Acinetobacter indicus]
MKKLVIGLGVLACSSIISANTVTTINLNGRYALDCSKEQAHALSYVVGNKSIIRLLAAKQKHAHFKSEGLKPVEIANYHYVQTRQYQGYRVDFYQQNQKNYIRVKNTGMTNFFGSQTQELLEQCQTKI